MLVIPPFAENWRQPMGWEQELASRAGRGLSGKVVVGGRRSLFFFDCKLRLDWDLEFWFWQWNAGPGLCALR